MRLGDHSARELVLPDTVLMADDVRRVLGPEYVTGFARVCRYTPIHGCMVCGRPIDLRVEHASVLLRTRRDAAGVTVESAASLAHALCAPSQVSPWEDDNTPRRLVDPTAVPGDRVQTLVLEDADSAVPVVLVELGMVSVTVTRDVHGNEIVSDRTTQRLLADGMARLWTARQAVAGLRQLAGALRAGRPGLHPPGLRAVGHPAARAHRVLPRLRPRSGT
ncbi:hypothetical protein QQY66_34370 [Streptomyces sp. DG2A-72]|uniref:hypothetical protein n=1 Tax=Streptomyces sp. DG2A-72 TaxID=3051386 RepID=UPI00265B9E2A|nr:hypothetical protein [Streptomyces sp. DG2A-72]MDO0936547.1 hypothetical protein [Streptomyces sp. DG2A-72]